MSARPGALRERKREHERTVPRPALARKDEKKKARVMQTRAKSTFREDLQEGTFGKSNEPSSMSNTIAFNNIKSMEIILYSSGACNRA